MVREEIERLLRDRHQQDGYLFPAYADYCFGNVPDTIRSVLNAGGRRPLPSDVFGGIDTAVEKVVLVVIDGFGLNAWKRHSRQHQALATLAEEGTVTPLTSIYPSETAAAITTLETGTLPCEHGRIGWNIYEPTIDTTFLAFGGEVKTGATADDVADESVAGCEFYYPKLSDAGIDCHRLQPFDNRGRTVTQHIYDDLDTFGKRLSNVVAESDSPGYIYAYLPHVDHVSHAEGTENDAYAQTVAAVCDQLSEFLARIDHRTATETLLLVTADHGHVNTSPTQNINLSSNPTVMANLKRHADGTPITMAGSPRNVHLHLQEGTVAETRQTLADDNARIFTRDEALECGLFGDRSASDRFRRRCGDLVVTHRELGMWFGDVEPEELALIGMHGGLNPAEMLVPFAAARISALL